MTSPPISWLHGWAAGISPLPLLPTCVSACNGHAGVMKTMWRPYVTEPAASYPGQIRPAVLPFPRNQRALNVWAARRCR
jgi:hypothetical protein